MSGPVEGVADVGHWAVQDVHFGAESIVDADGKQAVVEEKLRLLRSYVFAGKHDVASAVDHESCKTVSAGGRLVGDAVPTGRLRSEIADTGG